MSLPNDLLGENEELIYLQLQHGKSHPNLINKRFSEDEREESWDALIEGGYVSEEHIPNWKRSEGGRLVDSNGGNNVTIHVKGSDLRNLLQRLSGKGENSER